MHFLNASLPQVCENRIVRVGEAGKRLLPRAPSGFTLRGAPP
ncbi:hypothetical protein ARMA_2678 [Ardenticatena maritima]|uniref:Uncharacterized protein n=1 Tax=Ardenticatena maritima TaxID=872965 RepID=A0A0M8K934_9CHLR|nr:hypothetical protein ARMA_2678 [Ardenticatena maritima]